MNYTNTKPNITYQEFYKLVERVEYFKSLTGKDYEVSSIIGDEITFIRISTSKKWSMNLKGVRQAYLELTDFKTLNFKDYVSRTHSPALGILLYLNLLKNS